LIIDFTDNRFNTIIDDDGNIVGRQVDTGEYLKGGRIGLRQMADLAAEYSNFMVYDIKPQ
jgi:hypothetical protein